MRRAAAIRFARGSRGVVQALIGVLVTLLPTTTPTARAADPPPAYQFVAGAGGVPLLVRQAGDPAAPGILFIHGMAQSHLSFHRQFENSALSSKFHLVAFDLRGQGGSAKPWRVEDYRDPKVWADDVAAVMRATGLRRPLIVAWSFGGHVAMDYVRTYGIENVAGLAMVGSLGGLVRTAPFSQGDSTAAREMRARSADQRGMDLQAYITASRGVGQAYEAPGMTPIERQNFFATELLTPPYVRNALMARSFDNGDLVERLSLPVLFVRGSKDVTMPMEALNTLLERIPGARLSAYDGAGHLTFMEAPERFDRELAAFAAEVEVR